jgi:1,3-propanediol dehydrogenase
MRQVTKFVIPEIIFGIGSLNQVGDSLVRLGARRVFLATDPGVAAAGWVEKALPYLDEAGLEWVLWQNVSENPKDHEVQDGAAAYLDEGCDAILCVGGGSPMDAAKGVGLVATNGGHVLDYAGIDKITRPLPPMVMVPSTAGTGADVSQFAVITDTKAHAKQMLASKSLVPDISVTDPLLLTTKSRELTAYSGMDALTHAIEAYVSVAANPLTDVHALSAIELISQNLRPSVASRENMTAKVNMAMASLKAGICLSNAALGATHAITHQLGGLLDLPHGQANAAVLPQVMEFNLISDPARFAAIARAMGEGGESLSVRDSAVLAVRAVRNLASDIGIPAVVTGLEAVRQETLDHMVANSLRDLCLITNPRDMAAGDLEQLFRSVLAVALTGDEDPT